MVGGSGKATAMSGGHGRGEQNTATDCHCRSKATSVGAALGRGYLKTMFVDSVAHNIKSPWAPENKTDSDVDLGSER